MPPEEGIWVAFSVSEDRIQGGLAGHYYGWISVTDLNGVVEGKAAGFARFRHVFWTNEGKVYTMVAGSWGYEDCVYFPVDRIRRIIPVESAWVRECLSNGQIPQLPEIPLVEPKKRKSKKPKKAE